ncbi:MAG: DUF167 domain-containing protein [Thermoleophilia bacterium]
MSEGLELRLQPRGGRDQVMGERDGAVLIRIAAPPVDGKANAALIAFVAKTIGVPKSSVEIIRGETSRNKVIRVEGRSPDDVRSLLLAAA